MLAWLDFDTEYLFYGFIGVSAFLLFEAVYLLFFQGGVVPQEHQPPYRIVEGSARSRRCAGPASRASAG